MVAANLQSNSVGRTAQLDMFSDLPGVRSGVHFGVRHKRVVVERPAPQPIKRVCPTCGATFEDYTQRPNTVYCRPWCKTKMSYIKRDTAIDLLAALPGMNADLALRMVESRSGLPKMEKVLNGLGYTFQREKKAWVKDESKTHD